MKNIKKLNASSLKIFQFLNLLYEDKADYKSVIEIFKDEINETTNNNIQVTLNKYINTLKIFGIKVKKENNKFKLLSSIYTIKLDLDDLKSISLLITTLENFPDKNSTKEINDFIKSVKLRMNSDDKLILDSLNKNNNYDFSFLYSDIREQIEMCEQICRQNHVINIIYTKNNIENKSKCTPKEVIYDSKTAYLKIYDSIKKQHFEIPINTILSISTTPQKASSIEMSTTVVYKLKNRLAKSYKLKENETTHGLDSNNEMVVVNKGESFDKLLHRLMRYTYDCEIISPKFLRDEMIKMINETLNNYQKD